MMAPVQSLPGPETNHKGWRAGSLGYLSPLVEARVRVLLKRPGSGRGSDLARRLKPCKHPASTTRRPARTVRMHQERLRDLGESKLTARRAVDAVLDINPATL